MSFNLSGRGDKRAQDALEFNRKSNLDMEKLMTPYTIFQELVLQIAGIAMMFVSVFCWAGGTMSIANALMCIVMSFLVFGQIKLFGMGMSMLRLASASIDRTLQTEEMEQMDEKGKAFFPKEHGIEFRNVHFSYENKEILHGIDVTLPDRTTTAVIGPSGSGKTTLCNLIARFWDVDSGSVKIGGKDVREYTLESLMEQISMVFQNVYLFADTIENNIKFGRPQATHAEVVEAARKACCADFIAAFPDGYDTVIGEGSWVKNLKVKNISVKGGNYTGGVVGFADFGSYVEGITLSGENTVEGRFLIGGGIAGASHADIVDCEAVADLTLTDANMQGAGIIVGGQEDGNLENCTAGGTITAPDGCYSIGGLAGCFHCSEYAKNCKAENVKIVTGDNCWLLGGLAGHSGTFENAPTLVENGTVKNVSIETGRHSERIGGITGGGFYSPMFKEYYPEPAKSDIKSCTVSEFTVSGGKYVGAAVGYSYGTTSVDSFDGQMAWDGSESREQVGADESVKLEELK